MTLVRKITLSDRIDANLVFDILTEELDHYNDIVRVAGCRLDKTEDDVFFNGRKIGRWLKIWVEGKKLKGKLQLLSQDPSDSSSYIDELHVLIKCGAIHGCSAQLKPIRSKPRAGGGTEFLEQELVAVNLVAIGCDHSVLLEAKGKGVSSKTLREIFREQNKNASLAERIQAARFAVKLHEQDKPKMTKLYTEREREDVRRRAEEKLVSSGYKLQPRKKTISAYVDDQRMAHNRESLAKAKAMIAKWKREKALEQARARAKKIAEKLRREREVAMAEKAARDRRDFKRFEWQDDKHFVTWKGQKIPKSEWEKD
jgi:hypothetical protein